MSLGPEEQSEDDLEWAEGQRQAWRRVGLKPDVPVELEISGPTSLPPSDQFDATLEYMCDILRPSPEAHVKSLPCDICRTADMCMGRGCLAEAIRKKASDALRGKT